MHLKIISYILILTVVHSPTLYAFNLMNYVNAMSSWLKTMEPQLEQEERVVPSAPAPNQHFTLSASQLQNYLDSYFATLEYGLSPAASSTDISGIRSIATQKIESDRTLYIWSQGVRFYNKDRIDDLALESITEYIRGLSYSLTYNQTYNSELAYKVSESIQKLVLNKLNSMSYLDCDQLKPFFGPDLSHLIRQRINQIDLPYQPYYAPQPYYPSSACCICLEPFDSTVVSRIYLKPCGHDMCQACAMNWFFPHHVPDKKKTCPHCRSNVQFSALSSDLGL